VGNRGKQYREKKKVITANTQFQLEKAIELAKNAGFAKFDESFDVALRLNVNPKYSDQMVRGTAVLPAGTGKVVRVAVFAKGEKATEAKNAGADIVGDDDLVAKISEGFLDFDKVIATPDLMGKVGKLGKILGRRGLMPNPKLGTVTFEVGAAVKEAKGGRVEFKVEKAGIVHLSVGKKSFTAEQLRDNVLSLFETILKMRPASVKGSYVKSFGLSTTMGPGVRVDVNELMGRYK
jgi:large subunit ribosomal protein L1